MIVVKLMGGLGNQMFQYAFGRNVSLLHNTTFKVDLTFLKDTSAIHTSRHYELGIFGIAAIATEVELNKFRNASKGAKKIIRRYMPFLWPYYIITEKKHSFDKTILQCPENSWLTGFWQSEKYFGNISEIIKQDFTFPVLAKEEDKLMAKKIASSNSIGIHLRRGDYVTDPNANRFHGICSLDYYYNAINTIAQKVNDMHLFVFSDDIQWVKQNFKAGHPTTFVTHNADNTAYIDMQLMSLCKHNIIANSSFSWWSAWLNGNARKIVVAPAKWFNDSSIDTSDIIPEAWIKL